MANYLENLEVIDHNYVQIIGNIVPHHLINHNYTQPGIILNLFKIIIIIIMYFIYNIQNIKCVKLGDLS